MNAAATKPKPTIMLMSSNGAGLGHLTRLMAIGTHLRDDYNVLIFTLSRAAAVPTMLGYSVEYFASRKEGESTALWNRRLRHRIEHLLNMYDVDAVVFDGTFPYNGLLRALRNTGVRGAWIRRAMWKAGVGATSLATSDQFDVVIEPGDYASAADVGLTATLPADLVTNPVVLAPRPPLSRADARETLGLSADSTAVLLLLGAGQINDTQSLTSNVVRYLSTHSDIEIVVGQSVLSNQDLELPDQVRVVSHFPISEYFAGFDLAAMAAGYNSFHESLAFQLPTLFVPNVQTKTDDQVARARWGHSNGMCAIHMEGSGDHRLAAELGRLVDPVSRASMIDAMKSLPLAQGSQQAADRLVELMGDAPNPKPVAR